jgi:hypothetical protein
VKIITNETHRRKQVQEWALILPDGSFKAVNGQGRQGTVVLVVQFSKWVRSHEKLNMVHIFKRSTLKFICNYLTY